MGQIYYFSENMKNFFIKKATLWRVTLKILFFKIILLQK